MPMLKSFLGLLIVSFVAMELKAQTSLTMNIGYGGYIMKDMKELLDEFSKGSPVELKKTSSFPPYYNYKLGVSKRFRPSGYIIGVNFGYGSTGARVDYRDFSGLITGDILVRYVSIVSNLGASTSSPDEKWTWYFELQPELIRSTLKLNTTQGLFGNLGSQSSKFRSLNLNIQPTLGTVRNIGRIGISGYLGYSLIMIGGKLKFSENNDAYLLTPDSKPAKTDWSGFRAGIGILYSLKR